MIELTIYRRFFYNSRCYKSTPLHTVQGVQVHSTAANNPWLRRYVQPDDGRIGVNPNNNSHNGNGTVCANAYIGKQSDGTVAVYQTLPWNQRCWLSANGPKGNANKLGYVGFEICEDNRESKEYYQKAMRCAALLTAYLCQEYGLDPDKHVRDHRELYGMGLASNHTDIDHWLKLYGDDMDSFRLLVKYFMLDEIKVKYIDCDEVTIMYQAKVDSSGYLNLRSGKSTSYSSLTPIPKDAIVDVLDDTDATWWRVQYAGITGWAMSQYLTRIAQTETGEKEPAQNTSEEGKTLIDTIKLKEMEACLADALSVVRAALGRT